MSDELLSAMMDGQCTPDEVQQVLAALDESPDMKLRWSRMVLARDALAGTQVRRAKKNFVFDVMAAIEADEAESGPVVHPKVVPLRRVVAAPVPAISSAVAVPEPRRAKRWQPAAGLAAAASITAAVVVMGGNFLSGPVNDPAQIVKRSTGLALASSGAQFAELASSTGAEPGETRWSQIDASTARQLNGYLMEHSNSRAESGMGGSLSYARLAVRTADYRQAEEPR